MKIVAIDASVRRGVVSRSVETAARAAEAAGATVERVHLQDLDIRDCTGCLMCRATGVCKIRDDLPGLAARVVDADGVILGTPSYLRRPDDATKALLDRMSGYFAASGQLRLPGMGERDVPSAPVARRAKRAIVITACGAPEPLATFFGYTTGPVRELRRALATGGIRTIGSLAVTAGWSRQAFDAWENDKAAALGRVLAGKI
ncbi:MAG: flavodoxin family protein [Coriobacteriia bacterium]